MNLQILQKSAVATPIAGEVTLFMDADNNNALTAKFNNCTYKVLSAEPFQVKESQSLIDAQNDMLDKIGCALKAGVITAAEYQSIISTFQLYYTSTIDANGDLQQSISVNPPVNPASSGSGLSISAFEPTNDTGFIPLNITSGVADTRGLLIFTDRNGFTSDIAVTINGLDPSITLIANSYVSDANGVVTAYPGVVKEGTSKYVGVIDYDGSVIAPGVYTGTISFTAGQTTRYISVQVTVS